MSLIKKEHIIVVDDESMIRNLLVDILSGEGYYVSSFESGLEALEELKKSDYDLIITDINMPELDGIELLKQVKKIDAEIAVIMMTGFASLNTAKSAIKYGAFDYLMKPFSIDEVRLSIENAVKRSRLVRENARLRETLSIFQASEALGNTIDMNDLFSFVLSSALHQTGASRGSLMLFDEQNNCLNIKVSEGIEKNIVATTRVKIGEGIAGKIVENGEPVLVADVSEHPLFNSLSHDFSDKSFISIPLVVNKEEEHLFIPLKANKRIIGVLNVNQPLSGKVFTKSDLHLLSILANQAAVAIENNRLVHNLEDTYLATMQSLILILDGRSPFTKGHSERVTQYSLQIAKRIQLNNEEMEDLRCGTILHDVGKIAIPDNILNKPGKLTNEEFDIIKEHPVVGYRMLKPMKFFSRSFSIIKHHHERMDGKGYPDGLKGENLSVPVRITMIADAYDAMTSDRPYRKALTKEIAFEELRKYAGTQFDKDLVKVFIRTG